MKLQIGRYKWIETEKREERIVEWKEVGEVESIDYFDYGVSEPTIKIVLKEMNKGTTDKLLDSIISKLKVKAKTTNWIYETYYRTQKLKPLTEWVKPPEKIYLTHIYPMAYEVIDEILEYLRQSNKEILIANDLDEFEV